MTAVLTSVYNTVTAGIAQGRRKSIDSVQEMLAEGPFTAEQALQLGLVDELIYENELIPRLKHTPPKIPQALALPRVPQSSLSPSSSSPSSSPSHPTSERVAAVAVPELFLPLATTIQRFDVYAQQALLKLAQKDNTRKFRGAPKIALIYGLGNVVSQASAFPSPGAFQSSTLAKVIHNVANDPRVHVILFRINSPGGSYVAADTIHAALLEAKAKGKKIVVSMAGVAASGGYFAAAPADVILANDATLTGSIGVFGGKVAIRRLMESKLGISYDSLQVGGGDTAGMYGFVDPWNAAQLRKINDLMDRIYADFVTKVATGRGMTYDAAEALARGRVWTGEQARRNGLVDDIGGMYEAVQKCRQMIDPSLRSLAVVETVPKKKGVLAMLREAAGAGDAERDDRPLFTQSAGVGGGVRGVMEEVVKEGVGMLEAGMVKELQQIVMGGVGGLGSLHAADGALGEVGWIDRHGQLLI